MNKTYLNLVKTLFKRHSKLYNVKSESVILYIISLIAYIVTPVFILLRFSPNLVTGINFIISIISIFCIFSLKKDLFFLGILLYFIFRVFDFSDGIIARYNGISTFYGRFLDSILDIFIESFLILSISYFVFNIYGNPNILIAGIVTSIFSIYSTCIHDKYASLVRWCNNENKTKIIPYLRKNSIPRVVYTLVDLQHILIFAMPFALDNTFLLSKLFFTFIIIILTNYSLNIFKHIFSAKKNLDINAKDKKLYIKNE